MADIRSERMVLGTFMQHQQYIHQHDLTGKFEDDTHALIYKAMRELDRCDYTSLIGKLTESGDIDKPDVLDTVGKLSQYSSQLQFDSAIDNMHRASRRKKITAIFGHYNDAVSQKLMDPSEAAQQAVGELISVELDNSKQEGIQVGTAARLCLEQSKAKGGHQGLIGMESGFTATDRLLDGFQTGMNIWIGARPSVGKTAFMLNLRRAFDLRGYRGAVFSLETSASRLMYREIAIELEIDHKRLRHYALNPEEQQRFENCVHQLNNSPSVIYDVAGITIDRLRSLIMAEHRKKKLDYMMIDYAQLIGSDKYSKRYDIVSDVAVTLASLCKQLDVCGIILSQLSRPRKEYAHREPNLEDLRESGYIEQAADAVGLMHALTEQQCEDRDFPFNYRQIHWAKNKEGELGTQMLTFDGGIMKFNEYVHVPRFGKETEEEIRLD